ncbi:MAG: heme biosynthesis HemY N-terminal domain-containing protein, partial [Mariprofundus sp.]
MRLAFLLLLALAVSIALIIFPNIADQSLRIEAFGWIFETRQGTFIVALLALLILVWLLRSITSALFAGPGAAWRSLRMGSRKRREKKLRDTIAQWLDGRGHISARTLKR